MANKRWIIGDGASLMGGTGGTGATLLSNLVTYLGGSTVYNSYNAGPFQSGGSFTSIVNAFGAANTSVTHFNSGVLPPFVVVWCGANDYSGDAAKPTDELTAICKYAQRVIAAGGIPWLMSMIGRAAPTGTQSIFETWARTVDNVLIGGMWQSIFAGYTSLINDPFVGIGTQIGGTNPYPAYRFDSIHLNDAGYAYVNSLCNAQILAAVNMPVLIPPQAGIQYAVSCIAR